MTRTTQTTALRIAHAERKTFCAIFEQDLNTLYSLALLLTADRTAAEQCFLAAFEECLHGADVFPGWERSWSRRTIVKQAIRTVKPRPQDSDLALDLAQLATDVPARLMELRPFDRFVFAMTVLERFSLRECAALLSCLPSDVEKARLRVLQSLGLPDGTSAAAGEIGRTPFLSGNLQATA
jgi:DNA-directed RNA polymerase specialized sigma24 family protein